MADEAGIKTESREIDGATYEVVVLSVEQALELGDKILKQVGPVFEGAPKLSGDAKVALPLVFDYAARICMKTDVKKLIVLLREAMSATMKDGKKLNTSWGGEFKGRFDTLTRVLSFFLEVQYGSFLGLLPSDAKLEIPTPELT